MVANAAGAPVTVALVVRDATDLLARRGRSAATSLQSRRWPGDPRRRRQAVLPAPLLVRPQTVRTGLCQAEDPVAQKTDPRTIETTWRGIGDLLDRFTPREWANYLANAGYCFSLTGSNI